MKLLNPIKTADLSAYAVTSLPCPSCRETISIEIASGKLFLYNNGAKAQDVLEGFDADVRERFISGFCDKCFNDLYPDE